ncbi:acetoin utilization protein AcuC [Candidatus Thorarchaeota archaeon]|nr:MAG: acetoin utilization protein AcuC [Candidatus Thorarchaeota archaeon]
MTVRNGCKTGFLWSSLFDSHDYGRRHPIKKNRFTFIKESIEETGWFDSPIIDIVKTGLLPQDILRAVHSPEYIARVREISESGVGEVADDTPGFKGVYENALSVSGATVWGIRAILSGSVDHFFSPTGGFHHARYDAGGGFCVINDVAAAVHELTSKGVNRVLIADFDAHHGNGTQTYYYNSPDVMQISFHEDPEWMYPHDGNIADIGAGEGAGYNINMWFPMDSGDNVYRYAFDELVPPLVHSFEPNFIIFLPGFDAHYRDPLTHMNLSLDTIRYVAERIHSFAHDFCDGRLGVLSGGGYDHRSLAWGARVVLSVLTGIDYAPPPQKPPFDQDDRETWESVKRNVSRLKELIFPLHEIEY